MKLFLIDGYNKSLLLNVLKLYLERKNAIKNYDFIDIQDFIYFDQIIKKSHLSEKILLRQNFMKKIQYYIDETNIQFLFVFNTSCLVREFTFMSQKVDFITYSTLAYFRENLETQLFFLDKNIEHYIPMSQYLCTTRLNTITFFSNTFMPFGGYIFFNYLECLEIKKYYNSFLYDKLLFTRHNFLSLSENLLSILNVPYEFNLLDQITKNYLFKKKMNFIITVLIVVLIHSIFYLPYYIFFITKIKNKMIKTKNKLYLCFLLLLPISTFIVPSFGILFLPEIINIMCLIKLLKKE